MGWGGREEGRGFVADKGQMPGHYQRRGLRIRALGLPGKRRDQNITSDPCEAGGSRQRTMMRTQSQTGR